MADLDDATHVPADGGCRAWMVVVARFLLAVIIVGGFKALGVFLPVLQDSLQLSASSVGFSLGFSGVISFILGPVASALLCVLNYRVLSMIGGVLAGFGFVIASQAKEAGLLTVCMFVLGLGNCLIMIPSIVALHDYFDKRFAIANSLGTLGGAVGMMVLSPLAEVLIMQYGWQGAFLVFGALTFNLVIAGALFKPVQGNHRKIDVTELTKDTTVMDEKITVTTQIFTNGSLKTSERCGDETIELKRTSAKIDAFETDEKSTTYTLSKPPPSRREEHTASVEYHMLENSRQDDTSEEVIMKRTKEHHFEPSIDMAPMFNINESAMDALDRTGTTKNNDEKVLDSQTSTESVPMVTTSVETNNDSVVSSGTAMQRFWKTLTVSFGLHLFKKQKHMFLYMFGFMVWKSVYGSWALFMVSYALSKGLSPIEAAFLSSLGGLGNLIGRIVHAPIIDRKIMTGVGMWSLMSAISSVALALHGFVFSFAGLGALSVITGSCLGARFSVLIIVMKESVKDPESFKSAIGWSFFAQGAGVAIGTPLTGFIYDLTSSYYLAFFIMAGLDIFTCVLFLMVSKFKHRCSANI